MTQTRLGPGIIVLLLTLGSLLLLQSCASSYGTIDQEREASVILQKYQAFLDRFIQAPTPEEATSAYVEHHTEDAVLMFSGIPSVTGREQIQKFILDWSRAYRFEFPDWKTDNIWISGNMAVHRFHGTGVLIPRGGGERTPREAKYIDVWRRDANGQWRIAIHIFNNKF